MIGNINCELSACDFNGSAHVLIISHSLTESRKNKINLGIPLGTTLLSNFAQVKLEYVP